MYHHRSRIQTMGLAEQNGTRADKQTRKQIRNRRTMLISAFDLNLIILLFSGIWYIIACHYVMDLVQQNSQHMRDGWPPPKMRFECNYKLIHLVHASYTNLWRCKRVIKKTRIGTSIDNVQLYINYIWNISHVTNMNRLTRCNAQSRIQNKNQLQLAHAGTTFRKRWRHIQDWHLAVESHACNNMLTQTTGRISHPTIWIHRINHQINPWSEGYS